MNSILDIDLAKQLTPGLNYDEYTKRLFVAIDRELKEIAQKQRNLYLIANIDVLPEKIINLLAWQWHVDFWDDTLPVEKKRELVKNSINWHRIKGTPAAVEAVVKATYGNCQLSEWFEYNGEPYFFRVAVTLDEEGAEKNQWKNVMNAINSVKNARSWMEEMKFYYPDIIQPMEIRQRAEILQIVDTHQNQWNLGSARRIRWDKKSAKWNGAGRWNGLVPDELYRTRQMIKSDSTAYVDSHQFGAPTPRIYALGTYDAHLPYEVKIDAECMAVVDAPQPCGIKIKSDSVAIVDSPQHIKHQSSVLALGTYDAKQPYMTTQKSDNIAIINAPQRAKNDSRIKCKGIVDARINKGSDPREINRFNRTVCFNGCTTWGGVKVRTGYQDIQCVIIRTKYGRQTGVERL